MKRRGRAGQRPTKGKVRETIARKMRGQGALLASDTGTKVTLAILRRQGSIVLNWDEPGMETGLTDDIALADSGGLQRALVLVLSGTWQKGATGKEGVSGRMTT